MHDGKNVPDKVQYKDLGRRIRIGREKQNITQAKMAEDLEISNNHLSSIEHGREKPSLDLFMRICSYLNVSPDYLLLGSVHAYDLTENLSDKLKLCEPSDVDLANDFIELLVNRGYNKK